MPYSILIGIIAGLLVMLVGWQLAVNPRIVRSRRVAQLDRVAGATLEPGPSRARSLKERLEAAGLGMDPGTFWLVSGALGVIGLVAGVALQLPAAFTLILVGVGGYGPSWWLSGQERSRGRKIDLEMPGAIDAIIATMRVQPDVAEALRGVADVLSTGKESLVAGEFRLAVAQARARSLQQALEDLQARSPSPGLRMLGFALSVYARTGGDFVELLGRQVELTRDLLAARSEANISATDALLAARAIPAILAFVVLGLLQDPEFGTFYRSMAGQVVLGGTVLSMAVGYFLMRSMVEEVA
jgi:Flp pilus assembly protein TadB